VSPELGVPAQHRRCTRSKSRSWHWRAQQYRAELCEG